MALTNRQKSIVNPYYQEYGYAWENTRNQWVIAGIHDTFINFGDFPSLGTSLNAEPGIIEPGDTITQQDLSAYISVYPQNAILAGSVLEMLSDVDAIAKLNTISGKLLDSGVERYYTSPTSIQAQLPQNQAAISGSTGVQHLVDEDLNQVDVPLEVSRENLLKQNTSQLFSIPYTFSITRRRKIRESFGNPVTSLLEPQVSTIEDQNVVPFRGQPDNIDLYNWHKNALPGEMSQVYYYNPNDELYYFIKRTNSQDKGAYDVGLLGSSASTRENYGAAKSLGKKEILKLVGKYSPQNISLLVQAEDEIKIRTYLDKRPGSRWVYAITIPKSLIDSDLLQDSAQNESTQDIDLQPYEKAKRLINPNINTSLRHSTFSLKDLQESIQATLRVLKDYENIMIVEEITPDVISGFDIEREILKLETFYDSLSGFFKFNEITTKEDLSNLIEFVFREDMRISYIIVDGVLYSKGLGATFLLPTSLVDEEAPLTSFKAIDVFATFGNRTFGFVFNSLLIKNVVGNQQQQDRPLWKEFLTSYVLPAIKISPITEQRKRNQRDFRIAKPPNIFQKIDQLTDNPSPGDLSKMSVSQKDLYYSVTAAMGSCDSVQSTLLKEAFTIYRLANGKAPIWSLTKYAALHVRDELIEEKINQERMNDALRYAENPAAVARDVENWVNSEIACISGLIGSAIEDQILKPAGSPKEINKLVTRGIVNPPLRFSFKKGANSNLWALWKKQIQLMLIAFIKQLILGVLKDVFKAALGCGPEDPFNAATGLTDSRKGSNYGRIMLNDLIRGVDIVEIATDLNLLNKTVSYNEEKERRITTSAPRQEQILQLHRDVSTIVTPTELGQLLDGTASELLINTIDEMINAGEVDTQALFAERPQIEWDDKIVVSMYQESLRPRTGAEPPDNEPDIRYAILGFEKDNIVNYFRELGNQISQAARDALYGNDPITAVESYCDDREATPPDLRWEFDLSDEQKQQQAQEVIDAKRWELISLCSMLEGKFNFQLELEDFLDNIPNAGIYDAILRWIAALSNAAMEGLMSLFTEDPVVEPPRGTVLLETPMGRALDQQQNAINLWFTPFPIVPDITLADPQVERFYKTANQSIRYGDVTLEDGRQAPETSGPQIREKDVYLELTGDQYKIVLQRTGIRVEQEPDYRTVLVRNNMAERNNENGYSLILDPGLISKLPNLMDDTQLYNTTFRTKQGQIVPASNNRETIYEIISDFYFTPLARTRLPAYITSFVTPYFLANDDDCITTQEEAIAKAFMTSIESRVSKFFLNVGPLLRVYSYWGTTDTVTAISTYMLNKITEELKEKGLYGAYIQNVDTVLEVFGLKDEQAYSRATNSLGSFNNEKILFGADLNATQKFYEIIKQSIILVINRVGMSGNTTENFYDDQRAYRAMGSLMLQQLKEDILIYLGSINPQDYKRGNPPYPPRTNGFDPTEEQITYILGPDRHNFAAIMAHEPEDWYRHDVQYYLPVPLLTAMHIIYFDTQVDLTTRYPKYEYETNSRIGIADDAFLLAINPTSLPRFAVPYTGFPTTALGETFYSMGQMERRSAREDRECDQSNADLRRLDEILERMEDKKASIIEKMNAATEPDGIYTAAGRGSSIWPDAAMATYAWANFQMANPYGSAALGAAWGVLALSSVADTDFWGNQEGADPVNRNIRYLAGYWNWIKRRIKYGGEWGSPEWIGLDFQHILTTSYSDNLLDKPVVKWAGLGADGGIGLFVGWFASQHLESDDSKTRIRALLDLITSLEGEYQEYLELVRALIKEGFAQISADHWIDTHPDWLVDTENYEFEIEVGGQTYTTNVPYDEENLGNNAKPKLPLRSRYISECTEAELLRELIINIKEQQRIFAETRNSLR